MSIHILGDSHGRFCFANFPNAQNHSVNSVTMHRIGRDGVTDFGFEAGDTIFFLFGEIDCRCHIQRQVESTGRQRDEVINTLLNAYFRAIKQKTNGLKVVIVSIVPPVRYADYLSANPPLEDSHPFPFVGTDTHRVEITGLMNAGLAQRAQEAGYSFMNIHDHYAREDGTLKFELSDGICHILDNDHILQAASVYIGK